MSYSWKALQSMRPVAPRLFGVLLLAAIAGGAAWWIHQREARFAALIALGAAAVVGAIVWVGAWLASLANVYSIEGTVITRRTGILSRHMEQIDVRDVRSIDLVQGLWQRLLKIGDVVLVTASEPLVFRNVADPDAVVAAIHRLRNG